MEGRTGEMGTGQQIAFWPNLPDVDKGSMLTLYTVKLLPQMK